MNEEERRLRRTREKRSIKREKEDCVNCKDEDGEYIVQKKAKRGKHEHIGNR